MSGDKAFVATGTAMGYGPVATDGFTCATPLGQLATAGGAEIQLTGIDGHVISTWDAFLGLIPGSFGETSTLMILIGAAVLLISGIASWRVMLSVFAGGLFMGWIANTAASPTYPASYLQPVDQLLLGGFAFAAVFMATDPVTGPGLMSVNGFTVSLLVLWLCLSVSTITDIQKARCWRYCL